MTKVFPTSLRRNSYTRLTDMKFEFSGRLSIMCPPWGSKEKPLICKKNITLIKEGKWKFLKDSMKQRLTMDLVWSCHRHRTVVTVLGLCWSWRTLSVVASLHTSRGSLAPILQVPLMLHFSLHGGIPMVLDGVVCPVGDRLLFLKIIIN